MFEVRRLLHEQFASMQIDGPPVFSVFDVIDEQGREFALKSGPGAHIRQELELLRSLSHPAIVRAYELVEELPAAAGYHELGFTMDLLQGVDFLTWVRGDLCDEDEDAPRKNLPMAFGYRMQAEGRSAYRRCSAAGLDRIRAGIPRLASALQSVHDQGLVHFDVQPANVICDESPVLVDFGNTLAMGRELSELGAMFGLPYYVAPEFADSRGVVSSGADAYSLGVLLFEALTGGLPFGGDDPVKVITTKLTLAPPAPSELVDGIPPDLDEMVLALLARSPADRLSLRSLTE